MQNKAARWQCLAKFHNKLKHALTFLASSRTFILVWTVFAVSFSIADVAVENTVCAVTAWFGAQQTLDGSRQARSRCRVFRGRRQGG